MTDDLSDEQAEGLLEWQAFITDMMAAYDTQKRDVWRPVLDQGWGAILAVSIRREGFDYDSPNFPAGVKDNVRIGFTPAYVQLSPEMWKFLPTGAIFDGLATAVGQTRGDGDDSLIPEVPEGDRLCGFGLLIRETNTTARLSSDTFYLADEYGGFFTRRFMGGGARAAVSTCGYISNDLEQDEAEQAANDHPHFHYHHAELANLLAACINPREECREAWGENTFGEYRDAVQQSLRSRLN